jgi:hypothetical protein
MLDCFGVRIQLWVILFTVWGMVHVNKDHFFALPTSKGQNYACPAIRMNFENFELASAVRTKISKKCPDEKGPI